MKNRTFVTLLALFLALVPAGYLALVWNKLPAIVPLHFGADLKPDRFGDKKELLLSTGILSLVSLALYFLLTNLHRIDPKRKGTHTPATFHKLAIGLVLFITLLSILIIESARGAAGFKTFLFPVIGLLFAFIGNYLHSIKPNYFAGIRLPWTLSSDENWQRTHQVAGKVWFAGGLLIAFAGLLLEPSVLIPLFITTIALMVMVPVVYSYRMFKRQP